MFKNNYLCDFLFGFFCYLCRVVFKVCYAAKGWAPFRASVSGSAGLSPVISPRLQPLTAPSALRSAGRLSPARITVINSCASGWHRRQHIVTMVNSGAGDRNNYRDKSNPPTGDGSPTGRARGCGMRSYAALRLRPTATSANNRVIPPRGTGARQGERGGVVCGLTLHFACDISRDIPPSGGVSS